MSKRTWKFILLASVAMFAGLIVMWHFSGSKMVSGAYRSQVIASLNSVRGCQRTVTQLSSILGTKFSKVCTQPPYMNRQPFEALSGHSAPGYQMLDDESFAVWWLYSESGNPEVLELPRGQFLPDATAAPPCHAISRAVLIYRCQQGRPAYSIKED